jgi:hypothetical protein
LVKMCSSPAASWARSSFSGQNVWLSAPEPTSSTRRSSLATARAMHAPTVRKSSVWPVWARLTETQRSGPWRNPKRFTVP